MSNDILKSAVEQAIAYAEKQGIEWKPETLRELAAQGFTFKGRDPREPGRRRKTKMEKRLSDVLTRRFKSQLEKVRGQLSERYQDRKAISAGGVIITDDGALEAELYLLFLEAIVDGIDLFDEEIPLDVSYDKAKQLAAQYAREYVTEWIAGLDSTSAEAVRSAVAAFIETPGMTVGDVIRTLETTFDPARAERIAITEITRAYAEGNQLAGEDMAEQWPGVRVTKRWFTNNDDLVCPICGPLEGKEVGIDEDFESGGEPYDNPPAHVNCRCWTSVGTDL